MVVLYLFVEIYSFLKRKKFFPPKIIGILHLKGLGFGDLIMLSPALGKIAEIFPQAEIYLITEFESFIDLGRIKFIKPKEWREKKIQPDLIIAPTLNLKNFFWIFKTKFWAGYFTLPKIQSNFGLKSYSYHLKKEHYLWRGIRLIKALNHQIGEQLEKQAIAQEIDYPLLLTKEPSYFEKNLKDSSYVVLAPFSRYQERQWPLEKFAQLIEKIYQLRKIDKIVIIGGKSDWEREKLSELFNYLNLQIFPQGFLLEVVGKNDLKETCYLIKNATLFIGLDSGPAHLAYLTAPQVLTIFITVDPLFRLPLTKKRNLIRCLTPSKCPHFPCYSGLMSANLKQCRKCAYSIEIERVLKEVVFCLEKNALS